jgi:type 2 lantibiotic biosynthesis protein LanM
MGLDERAALSDGTAGAALEPALRRIAERASPLGERLRRGGMTGDDEGAGAGGQARLEAWCQAAAHGDWDVFRKRLAWDGLDLERARAALDAPGSVDAAGQPAWLGVLRDVLGGGAARHAEGADRPLRFLDPATPLPFEELLVPFVLAARRRLASRAGGAYDLLSDGAHATLERSLLSALVGRAGPTWNLEFSLLRAQERSLWPSGVAAALGTDARALYERFVGQLRGSGLVVLLEEYAVLGRLLGTAAHCWVEATLELLERLAADRAVLGGTFGGGGELGPVVAVRPSLSDAHRGQRSVVALTFASGRTLVYKPKDLGTEEAYNRLLQWLDERGAPLSFKTLAVVNRGSYGWVEFVEHLDCGSAEEVQRYYRRAGMLLAVVHVLEGTDCHLENIVASGEYPVLVDAETLLHPRAADEPSHRTQAELLASNWLAGSVLNTGLLPTWELGADGRVAYDVSGLGGVGDQQTSARALGWEGVNTDRMALAQVPMRVEAAQNLPVLDGVPVRLDEHGADVVAGYREMYGFLMEQREALLAPDSPLHALAQHPVRFLHRSTAVYGAILHQLRDPKYLRDGGERGIQLELLGRALLPFAERPRLWPLVAAEQEAMEQEDIPFFTTRPDSTALELAPGRAIDGCFPEPSYELVRARLRGLSPDDLEQQVALVEGSLYTHVARETTSGAPRQASEGGPLDVEPLAPDELVTRALAIAATLSERAIRAADGSATWIAPEPLVQAGRYQLRPVGLDLYAGACGIALFLATVERVTGGAGHRALVEGAVQPLRSALEARDARVARWLGLGAGVGMGGIVYALTRVGQLLDAPSFLDDARTAARLITAERIAADDSFDVVAGAAGAILGLVALYEATGDDAALAVASACGEHLLATRTPSPAGTPSATGYRAWATVDGKLLTGFSHGAAGIAYALARLHAITAEARLLEAAAEAIGYEDSVYSPEAANWPDLRGEGAPGYTVQWCHGAPGVGLARLGGLPTLDGAEIRQDVENALGTTERLSLGVVDHLCCGNLGLADVELSAGSRLARPALVAAAQRRAARVVARAAQAGAFSVHPLLPRGVYSPGFFQGTAGIGYELLRVARPDVVPSVLLWE